MTVSKMTADVIIIGGGVNGCATAYYLAKKGVKDVVVLEADKSIGHGDDFIGQIRADLLHRLCIHNVHIQSEFP